MFTPQATTTVIDRIAGSTSTVVLPSRLDVHTVDELTAHVEHMIRAGADRLVIDAADVCHTDQAGLEFIRRLWDLERHGVSYEVDGMSLAVRIALELNGLHAELEQLDVRLAPQLVAA